MAEIYWIWIENDIESVQLFKVIYFCSILLCLSFNSFHSFEIKNLKLVTHSVIFQKFPQKCAPSVDRFKPIRERLQKTKKVKANAQGYSHLPTHLMVPTYRSNTNLFKKISLGTQIFIFCQIWLIENSTMSSKQILIGQLWTREGANIQKITQCGGGKNMCRSI